MLLKPPTCRGCPLADISTGFMRPSGKGFYRVLIVGEALGEQEAEAGEAFVGPAGKQLNEAISWAGLDRAGFWITNAVWCRPPNNKLSDQPYEHAAVDHCRRNHLDPLIERLDPHVIVTLGNIPTDSLLGFKNILKSRGYVYRRGKRFVVPSVHPSFIQRGQTKWIQVLAHDLQRAVEVARDGFKPTPVNYLLDPSPDDALAYVERMIASGNPIAYDIETPGKEEAEDELDLSEAGYTGSPNIIRIGFSAAEYTAISIPFTERYRAVIAEALSSPNDKIVWNGAFDNPRLYAAGFDINGVIHDGMIAWHVLHSDLPKSLGFVATMVCPEQQAWKYLSRELPAFYNATDADVEYRATTRIFDWLKKVGLWEVYERHILMVDRIFARMSRAGMPINSHIRADSSRKLTDEFARIDRDIQSVVPIEVFPHHPKEGYVKKMPEGVGTEGAPADFPGWRLLPNGKWATVKPFVPSAGPNGGMLRYQQFLHQIPVMDKGKPTTNEPAIHRLMIRYPDDKLYPLLLERREIEKLGGTYVGWVDAKGTIRGGLRVSLDGRVHPIFGHNPSTLRISCSAPNLQNIPRADGLGAIVKQFFVAPEGYEFIEIDYSGIEALLVGHFARSERYQRLSRLGVHDFANAYALCHIDGVVPESDLPDLSWSDDDLGRALRDFKHRYPAERQVRKRLVHARNYAVGWKEAQQAILKEQGKLVPAADLKRFLKFYDELFPEIGEWQRRLCGEVGGIVRPSGERDQRIQWEDSEGASDLRGEVALGREKKLPAGLRRTKGLDGRLQPYGETGSGWVTNPFGYLHRFNRAIEWERVGPGWEWKLGSDAKRLIAFLPQSTAAAIIIEAIIRAAEDPEILDSLRLMVHDSLILEVPVGRAAAIADRLRAIMEAPVPQLNGLVVGTETKRGKSWGDMK